MSGPTKKQLLDSNRALSKALSRLLSSHKDYTHSQARGWPGGKYDYPDHGWSLEIEMDAETALLEHGVHP